MSIDNHEPWRNHPYWWDSGPDNQPLNLELLARAVEEIPEQADCVVVGAGYSGLSAALTLARAGRSVIVLDSSQPGYGCSGRNGGLIGPSFHKLGLAGLRARLGEAKAAASKARRALKCKFRRFMIDVNLTNTNTK